MSEKSALLQDADQAFTELRGAIEGLSDDEMRRVWLGSWGVREILIHISGWHDEMIPALGRIGQGQARLPGRHLRRLRRVERALRRPRAGVKPADVVAELEASHRAFVAAAAAVPEALFAPGGAARDSFDGAGAGHYREHTAQIRQWRGQ